MNTENIIINKGYSDPAKWHSEDTVWVLGLFGTAIGAGVLFLPINAGIGGFWPLLIVFVLAFPITYLAHAGKQYYRCYWRAFWRAGGKSIYRHLFLRRLYHSDYVCGGYHQHRAELYHPPVGNGRASPVAGGHRSDPRADVYRPFRTAFDNAGDEHPGLSLHHLAYFYGTFSDSALERRNFANRKLQRHGRWAGDHVIPVDDLPGTGDVV